MATKIIRKMSSPIVDHSQRYHSQISEKMQISFRQVAATAGLLEEGATIPFISRYRKEVTGSLDEVQITAVRDQLKDLAEIDKRRKAIMDSLVARDLLTATLKADLRDAEDLATLEDIYLPHKQKRKTRALMAREKGLKPLAGSLFDGQSKDVDASVFINPEKKVGSIDEALAGVRDVIAEWVSEDAGIRVRLRTLFAEKARVESPVIKKKLEEGAKFRDYFNWQEPAGKAPGHRLLAMFRGESEKILRLSIRPDDDLALGILQRHFQARGKVHEQVSLAVADGYKRLLRLSLEKEFRSVLKEKADRERRRISLSLREE